MLSWAKSNLLAAVVIAVLLVVALGSAADSWRTRKLLRAQEIVLKDAAKEKAKELLEADEAYQDLLKTSARELAPVLRERDALKKALARVQGKPFVPPGGDAEVKTRWRDLGYSVRTGVCQ